MIRIHPKASVDIGENLLLHQNGEIIVSTDADLKIGNNCFFNNGCIVACKNKIRIGDDTLFGPNVLVFDHDHRYDIDGAKRTDFHVGEISIGKNCLIGGNSMILKGSQIGDNCVIAGGSIINGIVPDHTVVYQKRVSVHKSIISDCDK